MIKEGMFSWGIKMQPIHTIALTVSSVPTPIIIPVCPNKKGKSQQTLIYDLELLKKSEYQLEDLKKQYSEVINDPEIGNITNDRNHGEMDIKTLKHTAGIKYSHSNSQKLDKYN